MWILLAIVSSVCLGCYDVSKKRALTSNNVVVVLWFSVVCASLLLLPLLLLSRVAPELLQGTLLYVPTIDARTHGLILLKSVLVLSSRLFAYIAVKNLPITFVSPINATRPMWTLLGAVVLFQEVLNGWQWGGIIIALVSFLAFSLVGQQEGIRFTHNRYVYAMLLGTFLGAVSGLYDKYLMRDIDHNAVLVYYTLYQCALWSVAIALAAVCKPSFRLNIRQVARPLWIAGISVFHILSDFVYFIALTYPDSLISVISTVRYSGVIIPFLYGSIVLHDKHPKTKGACLAGVLLGMLFLLVGSL